MITISIFKEIQNNFINNPLIIHQKIMKIKHKKVINVILQNSKMDQLHDKIIIKGIIFKLNLMTYKKQKLNK